MKLNSWTIVYQTDEKQVNDFKFIDVGVLANELYIKIKNGNCALLIKTDEQETKSSNYIKECVYSQAEIIADILSWKFNIPLKNHKIFKGNIKKIKKNNTEVKSDKKYINLFPFSYTERNSQILSAYREIMNQPNGPLRFIMSYRLIEVFSRENKVSTNNFILNLLPDIYQVQDLRSNKKIDILTHSRNRIHATDSKYSFPYRYFEEASKEMNKQLRKILVVEFSRNI